jgi:hypothetical protein
MTITKRTVHAQQTLDVMGDKLVSEVGAQDVMKACRP